MCSLLDYLGGKLEAYVALLPKVQLVRTTKREGLVRARMLGEFLPFEVFFINCRAIMTKGMVFRYTWVYSKEDTMAHTRRLVVTS